MQSEEKLLKCLLKKETYGFDQRQLYQMEKWRLAELVQELGQQLILNGNRELIKNVCSNLIVKYNWDRYLDDGYGLFINSDDDLEKVLSNLSK